MNQNVYDDSTRGESNSSSSTLQVLNFLFKQSLVQRREVLFKARCWRQKTGLFFWSFITQNSGTLHLWSEQLVCTKMTLGSVFIAVKTCAMQHKLHFPGFLLWSPSTPPPPLPSLFPSVSGSGVRVKWSPNWNIDVEYQSMAYSSCVSWTHQKALWSRAPVIWLLKLLRVLENKMQTNFKCPW